jgi:hypothetical protein
MPRRRPVARNACSRPLVAIEPDDLAELLAQAHVPNSARPACAEAMIQQLELYSRGIARGKAQSAASQAESLSRLVEAAKALLAALGSLTPALRYAVEPDYALYVQKGFARYIASKTAYAMAARELARQDPEAQWLSDRTAALPLAAREDVERRFVGAMPRTGAARGDPLGAD